MSVFGWSLPAGCTSLPYDDEGAYEEKIDGTWYAWDEGDRVYKHDPSHADARDDGYVYVGDIVWPDHAGLNFEPARLLRQFVHKLNNKPHTQHSL